MKTKLFGTLAVVIIALFLFVGVAFAATTKTRTSCYTHKINNISQFTYCFKTTFKWVDPDPNGVKPTSCTTTFVVHVPGWTRSLRQSWCVEPYYATSGEHFKSYDFKFNGVKKGYLDYWHTAKNANEGVIVLKWVDGMP